MIKAKVKELLRKLTSLFVTVHTTTVTIASASYAANARASVVYNNAVPEGAIVLGIIVNAAPNLDWFRTMAYMNGRQLVIRYHNEYTGALSGQFGAVITYAIVGGVLRNLSIFKAFRHFMSLQKGGGIDGQSDYKETAVKDIYTTKRHKHVLGWRTGRRTGLGERQSVKCEIRELFKVRIEKRLHSDRNCRICHGERRLVFEPVFRFWHHGESICVQSIDNNILVDYDRSIRAISQGPVNISERRCAA